MHKLNVLLNATNVLKSIPSCHGIQKRGESVKSSNQLGNILHRPHFAISRLHQDLDIQF